MLQKAQSNKQVWTKISETVSQNKPFLLQIVLDILSQQQKSGYFYYMLITKMSKNQNLVSQK